MLNRRSLANGGAENVMWTKAKNSIIKSVRVSGKPHGICAVEGAFASKDQIENCNVG